MAFYKELKTVEKPGGIAITAYEVFEKFAKAPRYEIIKSRNGIGIETARATRTTWKKTFSRIESEA